MFWKDIFKIRWWQRCIHFLNQVHPKFNSNDCRVLIFAAASFYNHLDLYVLGDDALIS